MLNTIWKYLLDSVSVEPEFEDLKHSQGNLSIDEIREIALKILKEQGCHLLEPRKYDLIRNFETNKQLWQITYLLKDTDEEYFTGARAVIVVNDETGEIISKGYVPR